MLGRRSNHHWHKARWHALNAPGVTPSCLPVSFDLAPLALVSGRGGENARNSCKSIGISSLACCEMWVKRRRCPPGYRIPSLRVPYRPIENLAIEHPRVRSPIASLRFALPRHERPLHGFPRFRGQTKRWIACTANNNTSMCLAV